MPKGNNLNFQSFNVLNFSSCNNETISEVINITFSFNKQNKLFRGYIDLEIQLREFDRCRTLYEKFLQNGPENCTTWMKFAELETLLGDVDRARGIYELAIKQPLLDMPEILWKVNPLSRESELVQVTYYSFAIFRLISTLKSNKKKVTKLERCTNDFWSAPSMLKSG